MIVAVFVIAHWFVLAIVLLVTVFKIGFNCRWVWLLITIACVDEVYVAHCIYLVGVLGLVIAALMNAFIACRSHEYIVLIYGSIV